MFLVGSIFLRVTCWLRIGQISCSMCGSTYTTSMFGIFGLFRAHRIITICQSTCFLLFYNQMFRSADQKKKKCSGQLTRLQYLKSLAWSFFNIFILDKIIYRTYIYNKDKRVAPFGIKTFCFFFLVLLSVLWYQIKIKFNMIDGPMRSKTWMIDLKKDPHRDQHQGAVAFKSNNN